MNLANPRRSPQPSEAVHLLTRDLAQYMAGALGEAKAHELVADALRHQGLEHKEEVTRDQALTILEWIAHAPGIVGITASFVKSRLLLRP